MAEIRIQIDPTARKRMGLLILDLIDQNVQAGIDRHGQPFTPYSTRPFARPVAGIPDRALQVLQDRQVELFRAKSGALWAIIKGGYLVLKKAIRPQGGGDVDLTQTGEMLRSLAVVRDSDQEIVIGFRSREAAQKAFWHTVSGAGKSRTIRDFLGLQDHQWQQVVDDIGNQGGFLLTVTL